LQTFLGNGDAGSAVDAMQEMANRGITLLDPQTNLYPTELRDRFVVTIMKRQNNSTPLVDSFSSVILSQLEAGELPVSSILVDAVVEGMARLHQHDFARSFLSKLERLNYPSTIQTYNAFMKGLVSSQGTLSKNSLMEIISFSRETEQNNQFNEETYSILFHAVIKSRETSLLPLFYQHCEKNNCYPAMRYLRKAVLSTTRNGSEEDINLAISIWEKNLKSSDTRSYSQFRKMIESIRRRRHEQDSGPASLSQHDE
jgi:hypothetical protein